MGFGIAAVPQLLPHYLSFDRDAQSPGRMKHSQYPPKELASRYLRHTGIPL